MNESIFRKESLGRMNSPEQLNNYIRVATPGMWMVIAAVLILLISAGTWCIVGSIPVSINVMGITENGGVICYVSDTNRHSVILGAAVQVGDREGIVKKVADIPLSNAELTSRFESDYLASVLSAGDWSFPVYIDLNDVKDGELLPVLIVTSRIRPIDLLLAGEVRNGD